MALNESEFITQNHEAWTRLNFLANKMEQSPRRATDEEVREFMALYRSVTRDLTLARSHSGNPEVVAALNVVVANAYAGLYRQPSSRFLGGLVGALGEGARAFRRQFKFILLSIVLMFYGSGLAWVLLDHRPDVRPHVISAEEEILFSHWKKAEFEQRPIGDMTGMWALYATNNPMVAARGGAMGLATAGIGSGWLMYRTGLQLGALSREMNTVGALPFLLTSLAPHGASELTGAIIACAAGLVLGGAIIAPGRRKRGEAIFEAGKDALTLYFMGIVMMYIAAPFEAFFSFSPLFPQSLKLLVGILVFSCWVAYWTLAGRTREEIRDTLNLRKSRTQTPTIADRSATDPVRSEGS